MNLMLDDLRIKVNTFSKSELAHLTSILFNCREATLSFVEISISKAYLFLTVCIHFSAVDLRVGGLRELVTRVSCILSLDGVLHVF